jgi:hypothetical protein
MKEIFIKYLNQDNNKYETQWVVIQLLRIQQDLSSFIHFPNNLDQESREYILEYGKLEI